MAEQADSEDGHWSRIFDKTGYWSHVFPIEDRGYSWGVLYMFNKTCVGDGLLPVQTREEAETAAQAQCKHIAAKFQARGIDPATWPR